MELTGGSNGGEQSLMEAQPLGEEKQVHVTSLIPLAKISECVHGAPSKAEQSPSPLGLRT